MLILFFSSSFFILYISNFLKPPHPFSNDDMSPTLQRQYKQLAIKPFNFQPLILNIHTIQHLFTHLLLFLPFTTDKSPTSYLIKASSKWPMKLTQSPLLWKGPWSIDRLCMPHAYILASKSILSAFKYIRVPLLLNKEQTSKVLEKTSLADPTSIPSFIVCFFGKGFLYTCSIYFFIFHSLLFKMTSLMHDFF